MKKKEVLTPRLNKIKCTNLKEAIFLVTKSVLLHTLQKCMDDIQIHSYRRKTNSAK